MPNENLTDVEFIGERVLWFLKLTPEEFMAHIRANPRDGFHSILNPKNGGMIIIGREAGQRFWRIAERHLASLPDRKARTNLGSFVDHPRHSGFSGHGSTLHLAHTRLPELNRDRSITEDCYG